MILTLAILAVTVTFFILGRFRSDIIAMGALLSLELLGILTPAEAFSGFSTIIIFTTAGMFVISGAIVRSGLASAISNRILGVAGGNKNLLFGLVMVPALPALFPFVPAPA